MLRRVKFSPRRPSARIVAVAGLVVVTFMGLVASALAAPSPAQTGSVTACVNEAVDRITAEAVRLPASERSAYIQREVAAARERCRALVVATTTPTTTTSTTTTTTTTTPTTPPPSGTYEVTATGVIGPGRRTLEANCRTGDRVVSYRYSIAYPTGSNTFRSVNESSTNTGVRVVYEVRGTVTDRTTSLTVVCRRVA